MELNLDNDLVFLDLEATGLNVIKDRIVQIGLIKYFANGNPPVEKEQLINPGIPISPDAIKVHGITPEDVANKPTFIQVSEDLYEFIGDADLAGYNSNRFDIPMLMEEFARAGLEFDIDKRRLVDVQRIFYRMEPRTLKAALKFYCDEDLSEAHDAMADVRATVKVLKGQLDKYQEVDYEDGDGNIIEKPIQNDVAALHEFTNNDNILDATQRLRYNSEGVVVFNFGKNVGKPVAQTLYHDRHYYNWILNKDFSIQVKQIIKKLVAEYEEKQKQ